MHRGEQGPSGLEEFCRREHGGLVRMLSLYCGDRETAEDIAQETLARVWRRWDRVGAMDRPELWARRVAINLARSWFRRQRLARHHRPTGRLVSDPVELDGGSGALLPGCLRGSGLC